MSPKILARYSDPVVALASFRDLLLVGYKNGTVNIYESQSGDIIHVIKSNDMTHTRISVDGGKVLLASKNSGGIWDITTNTLTRAGSIEYNGEQATFSPDGIRVASIYGKFLKIWMTNAGYNHHNASTPVHDTIDDVYFTPDEQLVTLKSEKEANILDATTCQSLFTYRVTNILSIVFSLDSAFVAFLSPPGTVCTWNAHTRLHKSITVDDDVFRIALSRDGSQLASLSPSEMKLWDLKSQECLAHLQFDRPLRRQAQVLFAPNATSVSILMTCDSTQSWRISLNHNIDLTRNFIKNSDGTKSRLISIRRSRRYNGIATGIAAKLPIVFVPTTSNQDALAPCQSYSCDTDGEWILDQDGRHVLWIPPDENPRKFWSSVKGKKVLVQTESRKVYFVNFL